MNENTSSPNANMPSKSTSNTGPSVDQQIVEAAATNVSKELVLRRRGADGEVQRTTRHATGELQHILDEQRQTLRDPERLRALCARLRATDRCPGECVIRSALTGAADPDIRGLRRRRC